jgi:hypothetical protein
VGLGVGVCEDARAEGADFPPEGCRAAAPVGPLWSPPPEAHSPSPTPAATVTATAATITTRVLTCRAFRAGARRLC